MAANDTSSTRREHAAATRQRRDPKVLQPVVAEISRRLSALRLERKVSQEEVAAQVGVTQAAISRWENPENPTTPSAAELAVLARYFDVTADWLTGVTEHRTPLPAGQALLDAGLLQRMLAAVDRDDLERLVDDELGFGALWLFIPEGARVVAPEDARRRLRELDRRIRARHPQLWERWAKRFLA